MTTSLLIKNESLCLMTGATRESFFFSFELLLGASLLGGMRGNVPSDCCQGGRWAGFLWQPLNALLR